jgi:hypothetical protein
MRGRSHSGPRERREANTHVYGITGERETTGFNGTANGNVQNSHLMSEEDEQQSVLSVIVPSLDGERYRAVHPERQDDVPRVTDTR